MVRVPLLPRWLRWVGACAVAAFIFYTSILTTPPPNPVVPGKPDLLPLDKWRHFLAYAALTGTLVYATVDVDRSVRFRLLFVVSVVVLYGIGIEIGQSQIPNRFLSLEDVYANVIGTVLVTPWYLVRSRIQFHPVLTRLAVFA